MKFPLTWLNSYFSTALSQEQVVQSLFSVGLEVDHVEVLGQDLHGVVKAQIESFVPHPNADSLSLCKVNDGNTILDIVCGAKNFSVGDVVALATIGTTLPGNFTIKKSKIRGQESFGMLCSESELGLAQESEGILILPKDDPHALGTPLAKVLGLDDARIELELTPNRGDCLSVEGIVREVAAALGRNPKIQSRTTKGPNDHALAVDIAEPEACSRYCLQKISKINVSKSSPLIRHRLESCGVRSLDSVVDVTNYVMMEKGQPMHAFDADKVRGTVTVRFAKPGETLLCLDDQNRELHEQDLIIADEQGPLALAGIIGGKESAVGPQTTSILLESAHFDPSVVRLASKRHHLTTESSRRFERVVDPNLTWVAAERAVELFEQCGAELNHSVDIVKKEFSPRDIFLRESEIERILGAKIEEAGQLLSRLGFSLSKMNEGWMVSVPTRRPDIEREIDLIEEVARLHGFDQLPSSLPPLLTIPQVRDDYSRELELASFCAALGLHEVKNYSFESKARWQAFSSGSLEPLELANPLHSDLQYMKSSLIPGLMEVVCLNQARGQTSLSFFELGKIYAKQKDTISEDVHLAAVWSGQANGTRWMEPEREYDYFDAKGFLDDIGVSLGLSTQIQLSTESLPSYMHPKQSANIIFRGRVQGSLGRLHPRLCKDMGWPQAIVLEISAQGLIQAKSKRSMIKAFSAFPSVTRDLAFVVSKDVDAAQVQKAIQSAKVSCLTKVEVFDHYEGKPLSKSEKSLAFALEFSDLEKTLKDSEIDKAIAKITERVEKDCNARLR